MCKVSSVTTEFPSLLKTQYYHIYPTKILKTLYLIEKNSIFISNGYIATSEDMI